MSVNSENFDSVCVHAGNSKYEFGPVVPPIYQTSTFKFESAKQGGALFRGDEKGYIYTRMANPTVEAMENAVAELEGGYKSLGCASGMAAISTTFNALLNSGDHVICSASVYGPTNTLLKNILGKFAVQSTFVDTSDLAAVNAAVQENTKIIYVETPGNPTIVISDLEEIGKIAHSIGAKFVVDNTFLGPALQRPIDFGADIIVHSMTKSLNGHADVVAGIIVVNSEPDYSLFRKTLNQLGGVIDPFNSFLVHRGIKTLALRMERASENAQKIAEFLNQSSAVEWVRYPWLENHPQYAIAKKQQKSGGAMISFELKGGFDAGEKMINSVKLAVLAVSLGGVEPLIQHPASMTHASMGKEAREQAKITDGLVRLSVGIENVDDLIADLSQAME